MDVVDEVVETSDPEELDEIAASKPDYWLIHARDIAQRHESKHLLLDIPKSESPPRKRRKVLSIILHCSSDCSRVISLIPHPSVLQPRSSLSRIFPMHIHLNTPNQLLTSQMRTPAHRRVARPLLFSRLHLSSRNSSMENHYPAI